MGVSPQGRLKLTGSTVLSLDEVPLPVNFQVQFLLEPDTATVLAHDFEDNAVFFQKKYGKGNLFLLTVPLERYLAEHTDTLNDPEQKPYYKLYQTIAQKQIRSRAVLSNNPLVTVTEHGTGKLPEAAVLVNNTTGKITMRLTLAKGLQPRKVINAKYLPKTNSLTIDGNSGTVLIF